MRSEKFLSRIFDDFLPIFPQTRMDTEEIRKNF
nr:MAG TPA: hypothetical protein [Caudoviricetes sp.]